MYGIRRSRRKSWLEYSRQQHVKQIDHQLVPESLTLLHHDIECRFALRLATDILPGVRGRSERPGGQPVRFSEPIGQTQDNACEPEPE